MSNRPIPGHHHRPHHHHPRVPPPSKTPTKPPTGGRASVRKVLYTSTLTARSYNPTIKAFAQRLSAAGKPFKVVMTACMRKLLTMLNTMVRTNTPWNPEHTQCQNHPVNQPEKSIKIA